MTGARSSSGSSPACGALSGSTGPAVLAAPWGSVCRRDRLLGLWTETSPGPSTPGWGSSAGGAGEASRERSGPGPSKRIVWKGRLSLPRTGPGEGLHHSLPATTTERSRLRVSRGRGHSPLGLLQQRGRWGCARLPHATLRRPVAPDPRLSAGRAGSRGRWSPGALAAAPPFAAQTPPPRS